MRGVVLLRFAFSTFCFLHLLSHCHAFCTSVSLIKPVKPVNMRSSTPSSTASSSPSSAYDFSRRSVRLAGVPVVVTNDLQEEKKQHSHFVNIASINLPNRGHGTLAICETCPQPRKFYPQIPCTAAVLTQLYRVVWLEHLLETDSPALQSLVAEYCSSVPAEGCFHKISQHNPEAMRFGCKAAFEYYARGAFAIHQGGKRIEEKSLAMYVWHHHHTFICTIPC